MRVLFFLNNAKVTTTSRYTTENTCSMSSQSGTRRNTKRLKSAESNLCASAPAPAAHKTVGTTDTTSSPHFAHSISYNMCGENLSFLLWSCVELQFLIPHKKGDPRTRRLLCLAGYCPMADVGMLYLYHCARRVDNLACVMKFDA